MKWLELFGAILGIIAGLVTIIPLILRFLRQRQSEATSRTKRGALKQLAKLEHDLQIWSEPSPVEKPRAIFYSFVVLMLSTISGGLAATIWYVYVYQVKHSDPNPSKILALAIVLFLLAALVGVGCGNYFNKFLPWVRNQRQQEAKVGIERTKVSLMKIEHRERQEQLKHEFDDQGTDPKK